MRLLLALLISACAFGQDATPQTASKPDEKAAAKPDDKTAAATPAAAVAPAAAADSWLTGSVEFGFRWVTDIGGNPLQYRSVVNLGQGPKLLNLDFAIIDPKHRFFDRIDARADSWGGDPYNTAHVQVVKRNLYDLRADYRNIAYFNAIPSFANPFAPAGFDQQSFDIQRRVGMVDLQLFPGRHIMPYLVYERNSNSGRGITTFVQEAINVYPVPSLLRDSTNNYRGGVRVEHNRYHVTLEQGGTTYKEDNEATFSGTNPGDRTSPFLGTNLVLNNLREAYGIRGTSIYSKVLATGSPTSWMDLYGQFLYSEPKTDAQYFAVANGTFGLLPLLIYSGQFDLSSSLANQPHVLANAGMELRPLRNLRVLQNWTTNRLHSAGFGALTTQILLTPTSTGPQLADALNTRQIVNDNQYQIEAIWDATSKVAFRGGWRRVWGDATVRAGDLDPLGPLVTRPLRRDVGLAGVNARPVKNLSLNLDYEGATTDTAYFRTSLYNYHRVRARARYQPFSTLTIQANFALLSNENPSLDIQYDFQSRVYAISGTWTPAAAKRFSFTGEYSHLTLNSSIDYLTLPFLTQALSIYKENANMGLATVDVVLPKIGGVAGKLSGGGSLFVSTGTRPTSYYQPFGRLSVPLRKYLQWNTEWRWYGFGETAYMYEAFRAHTFLTGLRLSK